MKTYIMEQNMSSNSPNHVLQNDTYHVNILRIWIFLDCQYSKGILRVWIFLELSKVAQI